MNWFFKESRQETLSRKTLEYANYRCFYRHFLYSHLLMLLMQRSSVEVLVMAINYEPKK